MDSVKKSSSLCLTVAFVFLFLYAVSLGAAPFLFKWFVDFVNGDAVEFTVLLTAFYLSAVPAGLTLVFIIKLFLNIKSDQVFVKRNVSYLNCISWCCFSVVPITAAASFFYISLLFIALCAAFMGLIVSAVKNIMSAAVQIKTENELTI